MVLVSRGRADAYGTRVGAADKRSPRRDVKKIANAAEGVSELVLEQNFHPPRKDKKIEVTFTRSRSISGRVYTERELRFRR